MKRQLQKLISYGVYGGLSRTDKLSVQTSNTLAIVGMVSSAIVALFTGLQGGVWYVYIISILGFIGCLSLDAKRQYFFSSAVLYVSYIFTIIVLGILGKNSDWFLWLLPVMMMSFFIFSVKEKSTSITLALSTWVIFALLQIKVQDVWPIQEIILGLGLVIVSYYAKHLTEQTELALLEERETSKRLLHNFLPEKIAEKLRENGNQPPMIAQRYEHVTVLFADIVNFTPMSEKLTPEALVAVLNELFTEFDLLIEKYKLEKIKTIGDAYMVAGGLPKDLPNHECAAADFAVEMLSTIKRLDKKWKYDLDMRIGMHCGPVVAGVIGKQKFAFDMWGDTVNVAARMESHGMPGYIHISEPLADILQEKYAISQRGWVEVKGKGMMQTFWLKGKEEPSTEKTKSSKMRNRDISEMTISLEPADIASHKGFFPESSKTVSSLFGDAKESVVASTSTQKSPTETPKSTDKKTANPFAKKPSLSNSLGKTDTVPSAVLSSPSNDNKTSVSKMGKTSETVHNPNTETSKSSSTTTQLEQAKKTVKNPFAALATKNTTPTEQKTSTQKTSTMPQKSEPATSKKLAWPNKR